MEEPQKIIEPLLKSLTDYGHTYVELLRLKSIRQATAIGASILTQTLILLILTVSIVSLNIALALWLGDCMGKSYWGFLTVGGFYILIVLLLLISKTQLRNKIQNSLIQKIQASN